MVTMPPDEDTPVKRVDLIFSKMDKDQDDKLNVDEFMEYAVNDPSILQAISLYDGLV